MEEQRLNMDLKKKGHSVGHGTGNLTYNLTKDRPWEQHLECSEKVVLKFPVHQNHRRGLFK